MWRSRGTTTLPARCRRPTCESSWRARSGAGFAAWPRCLKADGGPSHVRASSADRRVASPGRLSVNDPGAITVDAPHRQRRAQRVAADPKAAGSRSRQGDQRAKRAAANCPFESRGSARAFWDTCAAKPLNSSGQRVCLRWSRGFRLQVGTQAPRLALGAAGRGSPEGMAALPDLRSRTGRAVGTRAAGPTGPAWMDPPREELIAKCPEHGRRPFNDPTLSSPRR